jgi:hypothetical protein
MKKITIAILIVVLAGFSFGQTKKPTTSKPQNPNQKEINILNLEMEKALYLSEIESLKYFIDTILINPKQDADIESDKFLKHTANYKVVNSENEYIEGKILQNGYEVYANKLKVIKTKNYTVFIFIGHKQIDYDGRNIVYYVFSKEKKLKIQIYGDVNLKTYVYYDNNGKVILAKEEGINETTNKKEVKTFTDPTDPISWDDFIATYKIEGLVSN